MSATVAIAASAVAISASNSAQIAEQKRDMCELYVEGFDSKGASVQSQKHYAECVKLLNPEPMPEGLAYFFKGCILVILLFAIIGAVKGFREAGWGFGTKCVDTFMMGLMWACMAAMAIFVLVLILAGIVFILVG